MDNGPATVKYLTGKPHSGEFGEGEIPCLKEIEVPTLIYGSQAEMNTANGWVWPTPKNQYDQVKSTVKELYVDNHKELDFMTAHTWIKKPTEYCGGVAAEVLLSFLRRHLMDSGEVRSDKPADALYWE